ncbi:MAG: hypothetical protein HQ517_02085 [SAR324 cluster bacterium]|nr:hypothetical protein [SAR324 cluster bacterium]
MNAVRDTFFSILRQQTTFSAIEILPDDLSDLGVLRLDILDHSIWENEELVPVADDNVLSVGDEPDLLLRRNAVVRIRASLFEAETGKPILRRIFSQSFQQIYVNQQSINNRPDKELEIQRMTSLLFSKILINIRVDQEENRLNDFELGLDDSFFSRYIFGLENLRIQKGIRFAKAGKIEQAELIWKVIIYETAKDQADEIYLINKASALYNLGIIYTSKKRWLLAAEMFSKANRIKQTLKYAQAWADSMEHWLEVQKEAQTASKQEIVKGEQTKIPKKQNKQKLEKNTEITSTNAEQNNALLLNAQDLWPLDPDIKKIKTPAQTTIQ